MRCGNCGFLNTDSRKSCEKCGSALSQSSEKPFVRRDEPVAYGAPTMKGKPAQHTSVDTSGVETPAAVHLCPFCKYYPLKFAVSVEHPCINCKRTGEAVAATPTPSGAGTIGIANPGFLNATGPGTVTLTNTQTGKSVSFKGDQVLKRDMINPDDMGLSSNGHVQFVKDKNGEWYISDVSSNKATFIQVQGKMPVPQETIVLLGRNFYKVTFD